MRLTQVHLSYYRTRKLNPSWAKLLPTATYRPSIDACVNAHADVREQQLDVRNALNTLQMGARNCKRKTGTTTPYRDYLTERITRHGGMSGMKPKERRLLLRIAKRIGVTSNVIRTLTAVATYNSRHTGSRQDGRS